jgi:hypothetical protein
VEPEKKLSDLQAAGIPIVPVLIAAVVGFSAGLALSTFLHAKLTPKAAPCADCQQRQMMWAAGNGARVVTPAPTTTAAKSSPRMIFDQQTGQMKEIWVTDEAAAGGD